jgi:hypothetical protein
LGKKVYEAGILRELGSQIAELSVWALLKQIETGEQFTEIISFYLSYIGEAQALLKRTIIQKETPYLELEKRIALSDPKLALGEFEEYRPALKRYTEALEKLYPRVKEFEALYARAMTHSNTNVNVLKCSLLQEAKECIHKIKQINV